MEDINVKSVRYPVSIDQKFEKIALKLGRTKRQLFIQMIDYFYKSKKDPTDLNDELLKNTLMKNHQQYIGFIKAQENMLLIPIKAELDRVAKLQRVIADSFNANLFKPNAAMLKDQQSHADAFVEIAKVLDILCKSLKNQERLKTQFMWILDNYITARDAFGIRTSAAEKQRLIALAREQIRLL